MKKPVARCIKCGALLSAWEIRAAGTFPCPKCQTDLEACSSYANWISAANLLFSASAFFIFGFKGWRLLFAVLLSWFPLQFLLSNLVPYILPPKIELGDPRAPFQKLRDPVELNLSGKKRR